MNNNQRRAARRGVAVVELALTLPVLVMFVLGSIEICNMIFLRQALVTTSYEAARISIRDDATTAEATVRAQEVLSARGIASATIVFNPSDIEGLARGTPLSVTVSAPANEFSVVSVLDLPTTTLSSSTNMIKE